jgi:NitT/TauT family transport system permease protein
MPASTRIDHRPLVDAFAGAILLMALWQLGSAVIGKAIILPSPGQAFVAFMELLASADFIRAFLATATRGLLAFGLAMTLGCVCGFLAGLSSRFKAFLSLPLTVMRAIPVLAIILLAMIWLPQGQVPVFAAFIMAFPVIFDHVSSGVHNVDQRLVDMARSFNTPVRDINLLIRLPAMMPTALAAARSAIGLCLKVVIAGEVLSQPQAAIGTGLHEARIMLETARVFAWAACGIILCGLAEGLFALLARRLTWPTH